MTEWRVNSAARVRQTAAQLQEHFEGSLRNLEGMCQLYDAGNPYIAFSLATEIKSILTENSEAVRSRNGVRFPTVADQGDLRRNIAASVKLLRLRFQGEADPEGGQRAVLTFEPARVHGEVKTVYLPFREWWGRDIIYCSTALPAPRPPGRIRGDGQFIPWEQRVKMRRRDLIELVRNKFGAHVADEIPEVLDVLQRSNMMGVEFGILPPENQLGAPPREPPRIAVGAAAAIVRAIAEEVLIAYGKR